MTATLNLSNLSANVDPATLTAVSAEDAVILSAAYLFVVENWAVDASEVAMALTVGVKEATALLKRLEHVGLVASMRVNGEKALTWQSYFDVSNTDDDTMKDAEQKFIDIFRVASAPSETVEHAGATGPRYTAEQLAAGREARLAGMSWPKVAEAAGVKSDGYFSRVLRATFADLA
jgi:hypothetical protein